MGFFRDIAYDSIFNSVFRRSFSEIPDSFFVGLLIDTEGTELTLGVNNYTRVEVSFLESTDAELVLDDDVSFNPARPDGWGLIVAVGIYDGDDVDAILWGIHELDDPVNIVIDNAPSFAAGSIVIRKSEA